MTKKDLNRITVLLFCNVLDSHKIDPFEIRKHLKPRFFADINLKTLPVNYRNSFTSPFFAYPDVVT